MLDDREQLEARSHPAGESPQMQGLSRSAEPAAGADQAGQAEPALRARLRVVLGVVGVLALGTGAYFGHGWWTIGRYMVATDDRKARRLFTEAVGKVERLISTSDLIRGWSERELLPPARLKEVLLRINRRARFVPPRSDRNFEWWWESCI